MVFLDDIINIISKMRKVKFGDIVLADDHNNLVDYATTVKELLSKILYKKIDNYKVCDIINIPHGLNINAPMASIIDDVNDILYLWYFDANSYNRFNIYDIKCKCWIKNDNYGATDIYNIDNTITDEYLYVLGDPPSQIWVYYKGNRIINIDIRSITGQDVIYSFTVSRTLKYIGVFGTSENPVYTILKALYL